MNTSSENQTDSALWCVELLPKLKRVGEGEGDRETFMNLAKGMPSDENEALLWTAQACYGLIDHRTPTFLRRRRRVVIFKSKADATAQARKETNEYWTAKVQPVLMA